MENTTKEFWLGLEDYENDPAFRKMAENEFLSSPLKEQDGEDGFARREFLKLMGASIAMATTACVRRPVQHIIPYAKAPVEVTPGEPNFYASTWFDGQQGYGLIVRTLEGRPIKVEGNPAHPVNRGGLPARAHAEVLSLYDPDRLRGPRRNLQNKTRSNRESIDAKWEDLDTKVTEAFKKGSVAIFSSSVPSPSTQALIGDFLKAYPGRHIVWDSLPLHDVQEANRRSYGRAVVPRYRVDQARLIVSIEADFLGTYLSPVEFTKQFSKSRKPGADMSRLVVFESLLSLTGMNADDRFRIKPSQQLDVVLGLIAEVAKLGGNRYGRNLDKYNNVAADLGLDPVLYGKVAKELWANRGRSLVMAGGLTTQTEDAVDLQVAVNMLNSMLENDGKTIDHAGATYNLGGSSWGDLQQLVADMKAGKISTLIVHNANPLYTLPADLGFMEGMQKVPMIISTSDRNDETALVADYVATAGNSLENWGDCEIQQGVYSIQQPTIRPIYNTRSFEDSLLLWTQKSPAASARVKAATTAHEFIRGFWRSDVYPKAAGGRSFDEFWVHVLQEGVVDTAASRREQAQGARSFSGEALKLGERTKKQGYELVLYPTVQLGDGRFANIAWLQELPDAVTKIVWDNYLCVSPNAAKKEGLKEGQVVRLKVSGKEVSVPVHIQPGLHDETLGLAVGYGRTAVGKVGNKIGHDGFRLASYAKGPVYAGLAAEITKTKEMYELVSPQGHHQMEGRQIVVETTKDAFLKNPASGIHKHHVITAWPEHKYNGHRWAMAIDLNSCTGCSACVIACQSENNVPTVGKKYVLQGREMHWIRIDRYYKGTPESPEAVFQPLLCQHCENAPCETVCPVLATVHNEEGLNDMIYNRCVGTRYCSNNCPYKVRRFNWFNYAKNIQNPSHMALNPDVTVRTRGVMEKCSFCVHRIRRGTNEARDRMVKDPNDKLRDGEIKTACEETCPADAIVFGDLSDPNSRVSKLFEDGRTYDLLEELNTKPRVRYLSRVRNAERAQEEHGHDGGHS